MTGKIIFYCADMFPPSLQIFKRAYHANMRAVKGHYTFFTK